MKNLVFRVVILLLSVAILWCYVIQYLFNHAKFGNERKISNEHWVHRGMYNGVTIFENTIAAFDSAKSRGIHGIELDIFYVDSLNDFVVTHDVPNKFGLPPLFLADVVGRYDTTFYYWLDLKNLNPENKELLAARLEAIISKELKKKVYIESGYASALGYLVKKGYSTIYWIQYNRSNFVKRYFKKMWIKWECIRYKYSGVSIGTPLADEDFFESFEHIPKFIFHIYTPELYDRIKNHSNIAVYLMDYIPAK